MTVPFLSIEGVSKVYSTRQGEIFAVDDVSLDLPEHGRLSETCFRTLICLIGAE